MTLEISFGEAWILETAVLGDTPMRFLTWDRDSMYAQFLNRGHGLARAELCAVLDQLFTGGDIIARIYDESGAVATEFSPNVEAISEILETPNLRVAYGLTRKGGERWERLATPDWEQYFIDMWMDEDACEVTAGSRDQLELVLGNTELLWGHEPIADTIHWSELSPWSVTNWKVLPTGYRSTYRFRDRRPVATGPTLDLESSSRLLELRGWAKSICGYRWV